MKRSNLWIDLVLAVLLVLVMPSLAVPAQTPPLAGDTSDVQKLIEAGQYRPALEQIAKLLPGMQQDDPATQKARHDLLMQRGECLLQLGERTAAIQSFDSAARDAASPADAAIPRAYSVLIRRSSAGKYQPKSGGPAIDILPADSRKTAMASLYADLAAAVQPKLKKALSSDTLQVMIDILPEMVDLDSVEYASTGNDTQTRKQLAAMGQRARDLMNREIRRGGLRFDEIISMSDTYWGPSYTVTGSGPARRTLTTPQSNELNTMLAYMQKIAKTARQGREFAREMGGDPKAWEPVIANADDLIDRINAVVAP